MKKILHVCLLLLASFSPCQHAAGEAVRLYDFGADEIAYLALPPHTPIGSVLLIPDALGTPEVVAARCDLLARLGFVALTVDFYNGQTATNLEKSRGIQGRLSAEDSRKTIAAALNLLTKSPQYRTEKLVIGVWGGNMEFLRAVLAEPGRSTPLVALSWLEPDGPALADPFVGLPRPLQVLVNNGPWMGEWEKAQATQPMKRIPADIHRYAAEPGFLLKAEADEMAAQVWATVIEFWKKAVTEADVASVVKQQQPAPSGTQPEKRVPEAQQEGPNAVRKPSIMPRR